MRENTASRAVQSRCCCIASLFMLFISQNFVILPFFSRPIVHSVRIRLVAVHVRRWRAIRGRHARVLERILETGRRRWRICGRVARRHTREHLTRRQERIDVGGRRQRCGHSHWHHWRMQRSRGRTTGDCTLLVMGIMKWAEIENLCAYEKNSRKVKRNDFF